MEEVPGKPLRHGYTTGSCATAGAKAALVALIEQAPQTHVHIRIPIGETVEFALHSCAFTQLWGEAALIKDGGDDLDATHGAEIIVRVSFRAEPGVGIDGGIGVGRVTKPGLPSRDRSSGDQPGPAENDPRNRSGSA